MSVSSGGVGAVEQPPASTVLQPESKCCALHFVQELVRAFWLGDGGVKSFGYKAAAVLGLTSENQGPSKYSTLHLERYSHTFAAGGTSKRHTTSPEPFRIQPIRLVRPHVILTVIRLAVRTLDLLSFSSLP